MKQQHVRRIRLTGALLLALGLATVSGSVSAQDDNPPVESTQTTQQDSNDFPWGLLGLLGLGGLAGLRRHEAPQRLETIDASRRA